MNDYFKVINNFLTAANATCEIKYGGIARNENWKEKDKRNWYDVTITTPNGNMTFIFWDSIYHTENSSMTLEQLSTKMYSCRFEDLTTSERIKVRNRLAKLSEDAVPTSYDVLSCLQKYDVGTFEDFCDEFGFDTDSHRAEKAYIGCIKEFKDLERIFTEDQLEELREIAC